MLAWLLSECQLPSGTQGFPVRSLKFLCELMTWKPFVPSLRTSPPWTPEESHKLFYAVRECQVWNRETTRFKSSEFLRSFASRAENIKITGVAYGFLGLLGSRPSSKNGGIGSRPHSSLTARTKNQNGSLSEQWFYFDVRVPYQAQP